MAIITIYENSSSLTSSSDILETYLKDGRKILVSNSISFKIQDNLSTLVGAICKIQGKLR